jgi:hypothetical protein
MIQKPTVLPATMDRREQQRQQQYQQPVRTPPHLPRARHLLQLDHDYAVVAAAALVSQPRPILTETALPHTSRATHRVHPRRRLTETETMTGTKPQSS